MPEQLFSNDSIHIREMSIERPNEKPSMVFEPRDYFPRDEVEKWLEITDRTTGLDTLQWQIYTGVGIMFPEFADHFLSGYEGSTEQLCRAVQHHLPKIGATDMGLYQDFSAGIQLLRWVFPGVLPEEEVRNEMWELYERDKRLNMNANIWDTYLADLLRQKIIWPRRFAEQQPEARYRDIIINYLKEERELVVAEDRVRRTTDAYIRHLVGLKVVYAGSIDTELYNMEEFDRAVNNVEESRKAIGATSVPNRILAEILDIVKAASNLYLLTRDDIVVGNDGIILTPPKNEQVADGTRAMPDQRRY